MSPQKSRQLGPARHLAGQGTPLAGAKDTVRGGSGRPGWAQSLPHEDRLFKEGPHLGRGLGDAPPTQERQLGPAFARELSEALSHGRDGQGRPSKQEGRGRPVTGVRGLSSSHTPGNPEKRCKMLRSLHQM